MIRKVIGFILIIFGLIPKSDFNHNLEYWSIVKILTIVSVVIGLVLIFFPVLDWIKDLEPDSFLPRPKKWLFYFVKILGGFCFFSALITLGIGIEYLGITLNEQLKTYYLSRNIGITEGRIIGETEVSYTIKN